jgi:hypothetical protein
MKRTIFVGMSLVLAFGCSQPHPAAPSVRPEPSRSQANADPAVAQAATPQPHDPHGAAPPPSQPAVPGATRKFGEPLAADATRVTLEQVVRTHQQLGARTVRVEGQVVAVCQHQGCWMELRDGETQAHVRMHGHSFFLPRDVNGKRAAMVGTIVAAHPPTECDQSAQAATGRVAQVEFDATGVEVFD